jgi:hypothetical protein
MGHMFNHCPFVNDKLRQLFKEEAMNTHQHVLITITITISNASILITQAMNPSIGHTAIPFNYQTTWSQPVTPIVPGKISLLPTSRYPMWYNVIPPFVPLDPSLYPAYQIGTKGLDSSIVMNYISYVHGNVYTTLKQHVVPPTYIPYSIGN